MIKQILTDMQTALAGLDQIKDIAEDWGQLDYYAERPPVNFPCLLFSVGGINYTDRGQNMQDAEGTITLRVADYSSLAMSSNAPDGTKVFEFHDTLDSIHRRIQTMDKSKFSSLTRTRLAQVRRKDGIREFEISYKVAYADMAASRETTPYTGKITIEIAEA